MHTGLLFLFLFVNPPSPLLCPGRPVKAQCQNVHESPQKPLSTCFQLTEAFQLISSKS